MDEITEFCKMSSRRRGTERCDNHHSRVSWSNPITLCKLAHKIQFDASHHDHRVSESSMNQSNSRNQHFPSNARSTSMQQQSQACDRGSRTCQTSRRFEADGDGHDWISDDGNQKECSNDSGIGYWHQGNSTGWPCRDIRRSADGHLSTTLQ